MATRNRNPRPNSQRERRGPSQEDNRYYPAMIRAATEMNCGMKPLSNNPTKLRGVCPFHEAATLRDRRTLEIDGATLRFRCQVCNAAGPPAAFLAMTWNVTARDAAMLLESNHKDAGARRPSFPLGNGNNGPQPANSAVLTRAAVHYEENVLESGRAAYPFLLLCARLDLDLEDAVEAGFGMSSGAGLGKRLEETGATEAEIAESPLFTEGEELLAGRITLHDRDYTGGVMWIAGFPGPSGTSGGELSDQRPGIIGMPGGRPPLSGMAQMPRETECITVTDDVRLYLTLRVLKFPAVFWNGRRFNNTSDETYRISERIVNSLRNSRIKRLALLMHDGAVRGQTARLLESTRAELNLWSAGREEISRQLNPRRRDISRIAEGTEMENSADKGREPEPPEVGEEYPEMYFQE